MIPRFILPPQTRTAIFVDSALDVRPIVGGASTKTTPSEVVGNG